MLQDFDFDVWLRLAEASPQAFEQFRRNVVEEVIERPGNNIRQLRGLQCRIDLERRRAQTPMKACLRLSCLMWRSFYDFREVLNSAMEAEFKPAQKPDTNATIIPFPQRK